MFTKEEGGSSPWDILEAHPALAERSFDQTASEPIEQGFIAPDDVLVPRPELGANVFVLFMQGAFIPLRLLKKPDGSTIPISELPRY